MIPKTAVFAILTMTHSNSCSILVVKMASLSASSRNKKIVLSLEQRIRVIKRADKRESARSIAKDLGVGKTQIQSIIANKSTILKSWEEGIQGECKYTKPRKFFVFRC